MTPAAGAVIEETHIWFEAHVAPTSIPVNAPKTLVKSLNVVWEFVNPFVLLSRSRLCDLSFRQRFVASCRSGRQVPYAHYPLIVLLSEYSAYQPTHRETVREDAHHIGPAPYLLIQSLLGWGLFGHTCFQ